MERDNYRNPKRKRGRIAEKRRPTGRARSLASVRVGLPLLIIAFASIFISSKVTSAQTPDEIRYREIRVPVEDVGSFVKGMEPRSRTAFDRLVKRRPRIRTHFRTARYQASWSEDGLLEGTAKLVRAEVPDAQPELLELGGNLAIGRAVWVQGESLRPAMIGSHGDVLNVVASDLSDTLSFAWRLNGSPGPPRNQSWNFEATAPNALSHQLDLELPLDLELQSTSCVVTRSKDLSETGYQRWSMHWSGEEIPRFSIAPVGTDAAGTFEVHKDSTYLIRETGIHLSSLLTFASKDREIERFPDTIEFDVNSGLTLTTITQSGQPLEWATEPDGTRCTVRVSDQVESGFTLQVDAVADYPRGQLFSLPQLTPAADWAMEVVRLVVQDPLEISDLQLDGGRCESIEPNADLSETLTIVKEDSVADLQFQIDEKPESLTAEALVNVAVAEASATADVQIRLRPRTESSRFELGLQLDPGSGWRLPPDSIDVLMDASGSGLLTSVLDRLDQIDQKSGLWRIRLREPTSADRPVMLTLRMRNDEFRNERTLNDCWPLRLPEIADPEVWIHVRGTPGVRPRPVGAEHGDWQPVSPSSDKLPVWISDRLADVSDTLGRLAPDDLFLKHSATSRLVRLERTVREAVPEVVSSTTRVTVGEEQTQCEYDLVVDPQGRPIDRLTMAFTQPFTEGITNWHLGERTEVPRVRKLPSQGDDPRARFEIAFEPVAQPFRLRCSATLDTNGEEIAIPLMALAGEGSTRARVAVFAEGATGVRVSAGSGLTAIPYGMLELSSLEAQQIRAALTYDDHSNSIPALRIRQERLPADEVLTAWRCDLRSFYSETGRPRHRVDYYLQNSGASRIRLTLPVESALEVVEVDGEPIVPKPRLMMDGSLSVPLLDREFPCVSVRFAQAEESLNAIDWLKPPFLQTSVPALQETWQVWLPRDYRLLASTSESSDHWFARVFGPMARDRGPRFADALMSSLRRRLVPGNDNVTFFVEQTERLLGPGRRPDVEGAIESDIAQRQEPSPDWGERLTMVQQVMRLSREDFNLLVDCEELARVGVSANDELPATRYTNTFTNMGLDRIVQAGLGLVVDDNQLIVTSGSELREQSRGRELIDGIAVEGDVNWFSPTRLQSIDEWNGGTGAIWNPSAEPLELGLQRGGWISKRFSVAEPDFTVKIYNRDSMMALGCAVSFAAVALGMLLLRRHRPRAWLATLLVSLALALLLPRPGSTLAIAFLWGTVISIVANHFFRKRLAVTRWPKSRPLSRTVTRAATILLLFVLADKAASQSSPPPEEKLEQLVYVPVDEDGSPTGVVYLDPEFHHRLKQREVHAEVAAHWLYRDVTYDVDWSDPSQRMVTLAVDLNVAVLRRNATVLLPTFGDGASVRASSIRVDGARVGTQTVGRRTAFTAADIGDYRVEFEVVAPTTEVFGEYRVRIPVAPIPRAKLTVKVPTGTEDLEVAGATAPVEVDGLRGLAMASLGPVEELFLRMVRRSATDNRYRQFVLMKVDERQIEMEYRFPDPSAFSSLRLHIDPQLVPLPESIESMEWNEETRVLETGIVTADQSVRFLLRRPIPVGRFKIPEVRPLDAERPRAMVAVKAAENLSVTVEPGTAGVNVEFASEEFPVDWSNMVSSADVQLSTTTEMPVLRITRAPRAEVWDAEIAFLFDAMQTQFEANLRVSNNRTTPQPTAVHRFRVPEDFRVRDVIASSDGLPLRLRSRVHGDHVTVFFVDQPMVSSTQPLDIQFSGELKMLDGLQDLPLIVPANDGDEVAVSQRVTLYRKSSVDLQADTLATVPLNMDGSEAAERSGYRFFCSWTGAVSTAGERPTTFNVVREPVSRSLQGTMTGKMAHDELGWSVELAIDVESSDGLVDAIHFEVPASLPTGSTTASDGTNELRVDESAGGPGVDRRILTVWLPKSTSASGDNSRKVLLKSRLDQEQTRWPHIRMLNVEVRKVEGQLQQFIELPARSLDRSDNSIFRWNTRGLLRPPVNVDAKTGVRRYRAARTDCVAELKEVESGIRPEIYLMNSLVGIRSTSSCIMITSFDLKPASETEFLVQLPRGSEMLHVASDRVPVWFRRVPAAADSDVPLYQLPLSQSPWPQRILVICRTPVKTGLTGELTIEAPRLLLPRTEGGPEPIDVIQEIWSVFGRDGQGPASTVGNSMTRLEEGDWKITLVDSFIELWDSSQVTLREKQSDELQTWLTVWSDRLRAAAGSDGITNADSELDGLFGSPPSSRLEPGEVGANIRPAVTDQLWRESQWVSGEPLRCRRVRAETDVTFNSDLPNLRIRFRQRGTAPTRYTLAGLLLVCAVGVTRWRGRVVLPAWLIRYPQIALALPGIFWWLFLNPSWIGLVLVAMVCVVWLVSVTRRRRRLLPV